MGKNKMKTKKAAAKRFKVTGGGKIMHKRCNQSTNKPLSQSSRRKARRLAQDGELEDGQAKQAKRMIPYWKKR